MPFEFYNAPRLTRRMEILREQRYRMRTPLEVLLAAEDDGAVGGTPPPITADMRAMRVGDRWQGNDKYLWLSAQVTFPKEYTGGRLVGLFDFGLSGGGNISGFESLCYCNGKPYQGVDTNHKEVFFDHLPAGEPLLLQFRLWSGVNNCQSPKDYSHEIVQAELALLDESCDRLYYLIRELLLAHAALEADSVYKQRLLSVAVESWNLVDDRVAGSDAFYASLPSAIAYIEERLQGEGKEDITVGLVGHTHIDVAWQWRLKHTREKCARSFSTVERMMDTYDEFKFLQSQAQLYAYVKQDYPVIYDQIKARVAEGRWEASGGMWVECDCNLVSGESIVRQVLYGTRFFEREFGSHSDFLWLPDVFGYSWALPQILKQAEMDTFITTKISWNDQNHLPYDTFRWRGIDGTEVLTHFITTPERGNTQYYTYNGIVAADVVKGIWTNYANKDLNSDLIIAYGYGDGGGGVNRDMIEVSRSLSLIPGIPKTQTQTVTDYCRILHDNVAKNEHKGYLPVWDGELYLEFHRGTYTSQARNKNHNRRMEFLLRAAELLLCHRLTKGQDIAKDKESLADAWRIVLTNQFHDIIPGSSVHSVYEDSEADYASARVLAEDAAGLSGLPAVNGEWYVYNTANWSRDSIVTIKGNNLPASFADAQGKTLLSCVNGDTAEILVTDIPPMGTALVRAGKAEAEHPVSLAAAGALEGTHYRIAWNEQGHLSSIYDKDLEREILAKGKCGNVLTVYEDKPRFYDAWELESTYRNKAYQVEKLTEVSVAEHGGLYRMVTLSWSYGSSAFTQHIKLYNHTRRIDFETVADWQEREMVLKAEFPVDVRTVKARYDIQFGSIERPTTSNTSWEFAKYEVVGHKWADLSETGFGVALLNNNKYGYAISGENMSLTLLKGACDPDYAADIGTHRFVYSILPHREEWHGAGLAREAWEINEPPLLVQGSLQPLFACDDEGLCVSAVKPAEDENAIVLRVHEQLGASGRHRIGIRFPFQDWCECNLLERGLKTPSKSESIEFGLRPFELKSFLIRIS